ncbi:class I SAM-dependent methyltransferase [Streptomyces sp. NPDC057654]|uniref:class I SAM-dependent methyltransferase n=1 Tax=Streptomyces sp. NPDC057654 TaxID=3346196 RepID=UPI0036A8DB97
MGKEFDELAEAYERSWTDMPFRRHIEAHTFLSVLGDLTGKTVLDLGCGSGLYTRKLREHGAATVTGIDNSTGMIDFARRREQHERLGIHYLPRDATQPPDTGDQELDGRFDLVASVYVLCYAPTRDDLAGFCHTARNALRPEGGRFVFATLNPDVATTPGWYAKYGMDFTANPAAHDGQVTPMRAWIPGQEFTLEPFRWSFETYEQVLNDAGFPHITWTSPDVSAQGTDIYGAEHWDAYLKTPHALVADCST